MSLFSPGKGERLSSLCFCVRGTTGEQNVYEETEMSTAAVFTGGDFCPWCWKGPFDNVWTHFLGVVKTGKEMLLVPSGEGAGMLLAVLQGAGQPP